MQCYFSLTFTFVSRFSSLAPPKQKAQRWHVNVTVTASLGKCGIHGLSSPQKEKKLCPLGTKGQPHVEEVAEMQTIVNRVVDTLDLVPFH